MLLLLLRSESGVVVPTDDLSAVADVHFVLRAESALTPTVAGTAVLRAAIAADVDIARVGAP